MARQDINHGTVAGDGTGENLFDAFSKVNSNFTELYQNWVNLADTGSGNGASDVGIQDSGGNFSTSNVEAALAEIGGRMIDVKAQGAVGDGSTDDTTALQAVLTAATAGDVIYFPQGTYRCWGLTMSSKSDVTIITDGAKLYTPSATTTVGNDILELDSCTNCRVIGFQVDTEHSQDATESATAFRIDGCTNTHVLDCTFLDCYAGVSMYNSSYCSVRGCTGYQGQTVFGSTTGTTDRGTYIVVFESSAGANEYCSVESCTGIQVPIAIDKENIGTRICNNTCRDTYDSSIYIAGGEQFSVTGNTCIDNGKDGIKTLYGTTRVSSHGVISGNVVKGAGKYVSAGQHGILIDQGSHDITVSGNAIELYSDSEKGAASVNRGIGIKATTEAQDTYNIIIDGNKVLQRTQSTGDLDYAVHLQATTGDVNNVVISNNLLYNTGEYALLYASGASSNVFDGLTITGNTLAYAANTSSGNGMDLRGDNSGITNLLVKDNLIKACGPSHQGINMRSPITDAVIEGNRFSGGSTSGGRCIQLVEGTASSAYTRTIVTGNRSDGNGTYFWQASGDAGVKQGVVLKPDNYHGDDLVAGYLGTTQTTYKELDGTINTSPYALEHFESGMTFTNEGAAGAYEYDLPAALPGAAFQFLRSSASYALTIDPDGTDYFAGSSSGLHKSLDSDGAYMKIECFKAGVWHVTAALGTITDE